MNNCIYDGQGDWTLFLDRDGVINVRLVDEYVRHPGEFSFIPGVPEAIAVCAPLFKRIIIITNQRGIARGLMSSADLESVHRFMLEGIARAGGRIDAIYHCPHERDAGCECRKPLAGMFQMACKDFPEIEAERSLMIGDSSGDVGFARNAGIKVIAVGPAAGSLGADAVSGSLPQWVDCCVRGVLKEND